MDRHGHSLHHIAFSCGREDSFLELSLTCDDRPLQGVPNDAVEGSRTRGICFRVTRIMLYNAVGLATGKSPIQCVCEPGDLRPHATNADCHEERWRVIYPQTVLVRR